MADPLTGAPEEYRRTYAAVVISELGDAFHYVALMWFALVSAGPLGVLAIRLADSIPALVFGYTAASWPTAAIGGAR